MLEDILFIAPVLLNHFVNFNYFKHTDFYFSFEFYFVPSSQILFHNIST